MQGYLKIDNTYAMGCFILIISLFIINPVFAAQKVENTDVTEKKEDAVSGNKDRDYIYDPTGKIDPFKSFIAIREEVKKKEKKKPKTYLETLEVSQLELIVIVISSKGKWAMVRDPKGLGHVVKEGTLVGSNGGLVHHIKSGEVVIREEYKDFRGQAQFKDIIKKTPSF